MKKEGSCAFGDHCPYAHNVFEYWLHPTRYRTQLCNDGSNCRRKICFFAHSLDELRVPACKPFVSPEALASAASAAAADTTLRRKSSSGLVGSPVANLSIPAASSPARASLDSARQSLDWGPVPMPSNVATYTTDVNESHSLSREEKSQDDGGEQAASPIKSTPDSDSDTFNSHEQKVIETVTNMLAQDTITPPQAATILQQMLPAASLHLLQSRLVVPGEDLGSRRAMSDPVNAQQRRLSTDNSKMLQQGGGGGSSAMENSSGGIRIDGASGGGGPQGRLSIDSSRSSSDVARMSFDSRLSGEFSPAVGNVECTTYATPAPAYPQVTKSTTM